MSRLESLDRLHGDWDVCSVHRTAVRAPAETTYACVRSLDLGGSPVIRALFRLRGLPASALGIDGLLRLGFHLLEEQPGRSLVLGLIGRFWSFSGDLQRFDPGSFKEFLEPGWAKASWGFEVVPRTSGECGLVTETRISCTDPSTRRRFRVYWSLVGPFSGWIRREVLRLTVREAEFRASSHAS